MKQHLLLTAALLTGLASAAHAQTPAKAAAPAQQQEIPPLKLTPATIETTSPGFAKAFLDSHFAQSQYDWKAANDYLTHVLNGDPNNGDLIKRSMILAMGAGDLKTAAERANSLIAGNQADGLSVLIVALDDFAHNRPQDVIPVLTHMPDGDVSDFIRPLLHGWANAAAGKLDTASLNMTTVHSYNGGLMAIYLGNKNEAAKFAQRMVAGGSVSPYDAERAADLFASAGETAQALKIYQGIAAQEGASSSIDRKVAAIKGGKDLKKVLPPLQVKNPSQGAAVAIFDLARILFQEQSDATARLFANMSLALDPDLEEARLLLANALARNGRYDEAIKYFSAITPDDPDYIDIQHNMADLMQQAGHDDQALKLLNQLFTKYNDVDALIRMGDIYRSDAKYGDALKYYNEAADKIGGTVIPGQYWYLLYARGMAYERDGNWKKAEPDLKAALAYQPNHPYLMNYLAYGWADQGINLDESLKLLQRAASLRPSDGYIADSLGWVMFLKGDYQGAVPQLEKAVEMLPYDSTLNDHLGDAYWQVGHRLEARFQWQRALDAATSPADKAALQEKLTNGPPLRKSMTQAWRDSGPSEAQPAGPAAVSK